MMAEPGEENLCNPVGSSNEVNEEISVSVEGMQETDLYASIQRSNTPPGQLNSEPLANERKRSPEDNSESDSLKTKKRKMEQFEEVSHVVGKAASLNKWYEKLQAVIQTEYEELLAMTQTEKAEIEEQRNLWNDTKAKCIEYTEEAVKYDLMASEARVAAREVAEASDIRSKDMDIIAAERRLELSKKHKAVKVALYQERKKILEG